MENKQQVCRICLQHGNINKNKPFQMVLNEIYEDILQLAQVEKIENPTFCDKCSITLEKAFEFKTRCVTADEYLYPYLEYAGKEKLSLTDIYCKINNANNKDLKICRICLNASESCDSLESFIKSPNEDLIKKYIPSLHKNNIQDSYICNNCSKNASWFILYIINCLESEKKLNNCLGGKDKKHVITPSFQQPTALKEKLLNENCNNSNKKQITYHERGNKRNKYYNCIKCHFKRKNSKEIKSDIIESKIGKFNCQLCPFTTNKSDDLQKHFKKQHSCNNNRFHCDLCPYNSDNKSHLCRHWTTIHKDKSEIKTYKCNVCIYECVEKSNLKKHMNKHIGQKEFKCDLCSFSTSYKESLKLHTRNHQGMPEKFKCDICSFSTKLQSNLRAHVRVVHNSAPKTYSCDICDFKSTRKGNLALHLKAAHDDKFYFKCEHCDFQSNYKTVLEKHILAKHTDRDKIEIFKCELCTYETIDKGNLTRHKSTHGAKTVKCSICNFSTKHKASLKSHLKSHVSNPVKFKCEYCNYTSIFKSNVKKHFTLVHDDNSEMYECYKCGFKAKLKSILISHINTHKK